MASEKEFVQQRFQIVTERLDDPNAQIERVDRIQLQRERRLFGKLLAAVPEGKVLQTLKQWRQYLGESLLDHKQNRRKQKINYHAWKRKRRKGDPKPDLISVGAKVTDKSGYTWVIDDRYLAMMDDSLTRLERWLNST